MVRRKLRRKKNKRQVRVVMTVAFVLLFTITAGYAAFSTNISLNAKGNIKIKTFTINDLKKDAVVTGDGLYIDIYESNRYIYKGANPDNYITFNNEDAGWRIYSIEENGTMKIIKDEKLDINIDFDQVGARTTGYCSYASAPTEGCNAWAATTNLVGKPSTFTNGTVSGAVSKDSYLNTYLNTGEYWTNLLSSEAKKNIYTEGIWNVGPSGNWQGNYTLYDLVSTTFEKKYQWVGKVGLLTKSEYMRASNYDIIYSANLCSSEKTYWINSETCRQYNYLYKSYTYKLISPFYNSNYQIADARGSTGRADFQYVSVSNTAATVRPVFYLKSDIKLVGKGTQQTPYKIYNIE